MVLGLAFFFMSRTFFVKTYLTLVFCPDVALFGLMKIRCLRSEGNNYADQNRDEQNQHLFESSFDADIRQIFCFPLHDLQFYYALAMQRCEEVKGEF